MTLFLFSEEPTKVTKPNVRLNSLVVSGDASILKPEILLCVAPHHHVCLRVGSCMLLHTSARLCVCL